MIRRRGVIVGMLAYLSAPLTALARPFIHPESIPTIDGKVYDGPAVTQLLVLKKKKRLYLLHNDQVLREYKVRFGFNPKGHKVQEGDGRTPEGLYWLDRRNYNSSFYLSVGISYPNEQDRARAAAMGVSPGGDIFIHGTVKSRLQRNRNWTAGCIALRDKDMKELFWMVRLGVPIMITV